MRHVDHESGAERSRFAAPNFLPYEGIQYLLRQTFPPYQAAMTFQIGVAGPTLGFPDYRPNPGGGASFGPTLTFAQCTDANANKGGCYTSPMRTSFGYSRRAVALTASLEADGAVLVSPAVTYPNDHSWSPQAGGDSDFPWTPDEIEQPPPEWTPNESWEPEVGYPWQRPQRNRRRPGPVARQVATSRNVHVPERAVLRSPCRKESRPPTRRSPIRLGAGACSYCSCAVASATGECQLAESSRRV